MGFLRGDVTMDRCEFPACDEPIAKIVDGHGFCANGGHRDHRPEVPLVFCGLSGCGLPVAPGSPFCRHHLDVGRDLASPASAPLITTTRTA
jgi:hypothetical protein